MKEKIYQPQQLETKWYQFWETQGLFKFNSNGQGETYSLVVPPPNVTGSLHLGHAFQLSIMDALARYHRMCGKRVLWQLGVDHAGIATQLVAENWLKKQQIDRKQLTREQFLQKVWEWKEYSGGQITAQQRRLGISGDWQRARFTLDAGFNRAVIDVFVRLYDEGLIYRGKRLVNWDPKLQTAVSDLEVVNQEEQGRLWYLRYPLVEVNGDDNGNDDHLNGDDHSLLVATTRPETLFGDVAVAVHPQDPRYQQLIGKQLRLPLTDRTIPIIADEYVDREFGSGCVKITPAHDFNDYQVGQRHKLPLINILTPDGHLNNNPAVPPPWQGLTTTKAREAVLQALADGGFLVKQEPHTIKVPHGDRSGAVIEPYLTDQWFMATDQLAQQARVAVQHGRTRLMPNSWEKSYFQWLDNIQDWCISRQLWWGHRIPAWYDAAGHCYVAPDESQVRSKYQLPDSVALHQDEDVLDTWFSSALWPMVTLGWPDQLQEFQQLYPTAVLVTAFDIIFFWVARMMMMGLHFTGQVPFKDVYITGLIRDSRGQKMSKSKGNVLDPIDLIDGITLEQLIAKRTNHLMQESKASAIEQQTRAEFPQGIQGWGADALRFTLCAQASMSRDINFDIARLAGYRNFGTKLWNATRFVLMQLERTEIAPESWRQQQEPNYNTAKLTKNASMIISWMWSQLQQSIAKIHQYFALYRFDLLAQELYDLIWYRFCDWHLELNKIALKHAEADEPQRQILLQQLMAILEQLLVLLHPLMPFVTEELWQQLQAWLPRPEISIMVRAYPQFDERRIDLAAEQQVAWLQQLVLAIRNVRGELKIDSHQPLTMRIKQASAQDRQYLTAWELYLKQLAQVNWIPKPDSDDKTPLASASTLVCGSLELELALSPQDRAKEQERLAKEITKLTQQITQLETKLANLQYCQRAPQQVVQADRDRLAVATQKLATLRSAMTPG